MPQPTYTPLATVTLTSSASSVTFSNIPATYRDLILVISGTATATRNIICRFNGDSGSNYSEVLAFGTGSSLGSSTTALTYLSQGALSTGQSQSTYQIMDYSATDKHKSVLIRQNLPAVEVKMAAGRWASTSALTSIALSLEGTGSPAFASGTTFNLFGVIA
jgi:hypothetical protein